MSQEDSAALVKHLWDRRHRTVYQIRVSVLYHLKRERFFDRLDKFASMLTAASATVAVGVLLRKVEWLELGVSAATAVLSIVPLVYNPGERARKHAQAAAEFRRLQADCERAGERWTEETCDQFAGRLVELEATDPAPLCALVIDCQNQLNLASGDPEARYFLTPWERWFKNWFEFDATAIVDRNERRREAQKRVAPASPKRSWIPWLR